jgi:hypothetical protein
MAARMFESLCQHTHEKLIAGKCPWCGRVIVNGHSMQSIHDFFKGADIDKRIIVDVKGAISQLHDALKMGDSYLRRLAAMLLGQIGPDAKETLPTLSLLLHDDDKIVRDAAEQAINRITTGESAGPTQAEEPPSVDQPGG